MCRSVLFALLGLTAGLVIGFPTQEEENSGGKHWVLIVAGSNGWYNYRHQVKLRPSCELCMTRWFSLMVFDKHRFKL